ncbi:MAG: hypothetical protein U0Q22_19570 [Acidimicrobiales bacterium]
MARSSRWKDSSSSRPKPPAAPTDAPEQPSGSGGLPPFLEPTGQDAGASAAMSGATPPATPPAAGRNPFAPSTPAAPAAPAAAAAAPAAAGAPPLPVAPTAAPAAAATSGAAPAVADDVAALKSSLADLQATVQALVQRSAQPQHVAAVAGSTDETETVSRIIVMANRTAEATIEEARGEAATIVAGAKAQSLEIIRLARELADRELAAERDRVKKASDAWFAKRAEITGRLKALEGAFAGYQTGLGDVEASIKSAVAELEADESTLPVIEELPAPDPSGFVGAELPTQVPGADEADAPAAADGEQVIDLTESATADAAADVPAGATATGGPDDGPRTSLFGGTPSLPADVAEAATSPDADASEAEAEPEAPVMRPGLFGR